MGRNIIGIRFLLISIVYYLYRRIELSENKQEILWRAIAKADLYNYWWFNTIIPRVVSIRSTSLQGIFVFSLKIQKQKYHQESEKERKQSFHVLEREAAVIHLEESHAFLLRRHPVISEWKLEIWLPMLDKIIFTNYQCSCIITASTWNR